MIFKNLLQKNKSGAHPRPIPKYDIPLTAKAVEDIFSDCSDFSSRIISVGGNRAGQVTVCFIDGVVDGAFVSENVLQPLTDRLRFSGDEGARACMNKIKNGAVFGNSVAEKNTMDDAVDALVKGFVVIIFDSERSAVAFEARSGVERAISEPNVEKAVKGARDAFIERIRINTMLVRRKLRTPELKMVRQIIGRRSSTEVAISYVEGIANPEIIAEVQRRLERIDIDGILATGNIEAFLSDHPQSPFPQTMYTERPDRFAINLLEGRVGVLVDGLPMGFIVPSTLPEIMRVPEDRSQHFTVSSGLRILRYVAAVITSLLPALYVSIAMYHQEMIPMNLLLSIIESKQGVPFPTGFEVLGMLVAFELLQEAGLRLPNPVGETVSIIGALIVGQSAVEAKVISPIAVIIVAAAGITGYTVPNLDLSAALRLCRFFLVICALLAGLFGVFAGLVMVIYHMCSLESFGVCFLSPLADGGPLGFFRMILRKPIYRDKRRDTNMNTVDKRNQR